MTIIYLSIFGALGVLSRHQIENLFKPLQSTFPYGVLLANTFGCLLAGIIFAYINSKSNNDIYKFILIGYCGGLTTFSSYCLHILTLSNIGEVIQALTFTVLSLLLGILAVFIGMKIISLT